MEVRQFPLLLVVISYSASSADDDSLYFDKSKPSSETHLSSEDFERARYNRNRLRQHSGNWEMINDVVDSVLYRPDRFEGDIVGVEGDRIQAVPQGGSANRRSTVFRSAVRNRLQAWPSNRIPYTISSQYSSFSRSRIATALEEYSRRTCVQFIPRSNERDYVFIAPDDGCYSTIGRAGGRQIVSIGSGCVHVGIIIHELMHSVGFFHEQSRPDRDEYVTVNWTNVADDMKDQFTKYTNEMIDTLGIGYDYASIMHYSNRAFTKNGLPTLVPRVDGVRIGQREGFSDSDATKINALYSCEQDQSAPASSDNVPPMESPRSIAPRQSVSDGCIDQMEDCIFRRSLGHCETIQHWMKRYCKRACGACT